MTYLGAICAVYGFNFFHHHLILTASDINWDNTTLGMLHFEKIKNVYVT